MIDQDKLTELSLFLNIDRQFLVELDHAIAGSPWQAKWIQSSVDDWNDKHIDQRRRQAIETWFKTNDTYLFELCDVHSQPGKKKIVADVLSVCKKFGVHNVLDYGGGIGEESLRAAAAGMRVSMADLPSLTFDFARWRAKYRKRKIRFVEISYKFPLKEKFDAIFCFEVLQHLFNSEQIAREIIAHLRKNGLLFVTTRFYNPEYSMALKKNYHFDEGMEKFFTHHGMNLVEKRYEYGKGKRTKFLFIYQKI